MRDYTDILAEAREATRPSAAQLDRVEAEILRRQHRPVAPRVVATVGTFALAALALFLVVPEFLHVDRPLDHAGSVALGPKVVVDSSGEGEVVGRARDMSVDWRRGKLSVEVEPNQGVQFAVNTAEGSVHVVGTGFDVDRGALGTTVTVRHGKVRVDCFRGGETFLVAGETRTCEPVTAAGALRRALALQGVVAPDQMLDEVKGGLALPDAEGAVAAELLALRVDTLVEAGRPTEAITAAEAALARPDVTRPVELHRTAARLRLTARDCTGALPHLRALEAAGALGDDAAALARCAAEPAQ